MGRLFASFRLWERTSQIAFGLALLLLVIVAAAYLSGAENLRQPSAIGVFGLLIILQIIILWANRGMVTPYTQAQRHYLAGNFAEAIRLLEGVRQAGKADVRALTLLGNTYRQEGHLEESEAVLREALELQPNHHFSLYGFGRTLMVMGRYAEASEVFIQAHEAGAPEIVRLDLGEAFYRQGETQQALEWLMSAEPAAYEPYQALMLAYLTYRLGQGQPPASDLLQAGLPFWEASAGRFRHTPYGQALAEDVRVMQLMI